MTIPDMDNNEKKNQHHQITLFATERIEDYVALSLALVLLILVLVLF
ncbi:MAG: hypothetical protein H0Z40_05505 [Desulfotomaculum sp.]|nr:hypothetical protein [Desulfotomaculum sp.]